MSQIQILAAEEKAMSRFSRPAGTQYRVWAPPGASVRIEYAADLFRQARIEGSAGVLFGIRTGGGLRVAAARATPDAHDPRLAGLDPIGIFATRRRGEVFLTEPDLERFEQTQSSIALIIAGDSAGFFTREPDGSIQSLRSREEVACAPAPGRSPRWQWIPAILLLIAAVTIPMHRWWPRDPALSVREDAGQLRIAWTRAPGTLELVDGSLHATLPVTALDSGIAYQPHTGDIAIRLTQERRTASARFIGAEPEASALRAQIAALASEADRLRSEIDRRRQIAAGLAKTLSTMKRAD